MSLLATIRSFLSLDPVYTKAEIPRDSIQIVTANGQLRADWSLMDQQEIARAAYRKCATAYTCVSLIADAVTESPIRVYKTINGKPVEQPDHYARRIVANPNPQMSEAEFMALSIMCMGMYGYAVVEKVRSRGGLTVQLWPLRPDWLTREHNAWVFRVPGLPKRTIKDEDLIIIPYRQDERFQSLGVTPLHIIAREIGIDVGLTDLLKVFLDAGGIPPWAVESPEMQPEQADVDAFREMWQQKYGGIDAFRQIAVLYGGMKLIKIGDSIGDMAWPDLRGITELKICQAYRVPAELVQAQVTFRSSSLTTTESEGAQKSLQIQGAGPLRRTIDGALTRSFLFEITGGDPAISLEFDTSKIDALQEDRDQLHTRVRADWSASMITLNQALIETGREPIGPEGDVYAVPFSTTFVRKEDFVAPVEPTPTTSPTDTPNDATDQPDESTDTTDKPDAKPDAKKAAPQLRRLSAQKRARFAKQLAKRQTQFSEIGKRKLVGAFHAQGDRVVAAIRASADPEEIELDDFAFTVGTTKDEVAETLMRLNEEIAERMHDDLVDLTGDESLRYDAQSGDARTIRDRIGTRIVGINETTRQQIADAILAGITDGKSVDEIADDVHAIYHVRYEDRAGVIARTETQVALNLQAQSGYTKAGITHVEMLDNPDHTDDYGASDSLTCAERHGMIITPSEMDVHIFAEHPNGSLRFVPVID